MYYYLVASFPMLAYDAERFWTVEEFLDLCQRHLSARDFRIVESASLVRLQPVSPPCGTLERWRLWEVSLRNELAALRAKRRGADAARFLVQSPEVLAAQGAARSAFGQDSPLAAEEALDRARWAHLDDLELGHYFDLDKVVIYHLRLQMLRRRSLRDAGKGAERFAASFAAITRPIYGSG